MLSLKIFTLPHSWFMQLGGIRNNFINYLWDKLYIRIYNRSRWSHYIYIELLMWYRLHPILILNWVQNTFTFFFFFNVIFGTNHDASFNSQSDKRLLILAVSWFLFISHKSFKHIRKMCWVSFFETWIYFTIWKLRVLSKFSIFY